MSILNLNLCCQFFCGAGRRPCRPQQSAQLSGFFVSGVGEHHFAFVCSVIGPLCYDNDVSAYSVFQHETAAYGYEYIAVVHFFRSFLHRSVRFNIIRIYFTSVNTGKNVGVCGKNEKTPRYFVLTPRFLQKQENFVKKQTNVCAKAFSLRKSERISPRFAKQTKIW